MFSLLLGSCVYAVSSGSVSVSISSCRKMFAMPPSGPVYRAPFQYVQPLMQEAAAPTKRNWAGTPEM